MFAAKVKIDEQAVEVERLEEELRSRPPLPANAPESEKDKLIAQLQGQVNLYKMINEGYEANLGAPMRKVAEDVEKEWQPKVDKWKRKEEEARLFAVEISKKLEKEMAVSCRSACRPVPSCTSKTDLLLLSRSQAHKRLQDLHNRLVSLFQDQESQLSSSQNGASPTRHLHPNGLTISSPQASMYDLDRLSTSVEDDLLSLPLHDRITRGEASSWDLNEQLRRLS